MEQAFPPGTVKANALNRDPRAFDWEESKAKLEKSIRDAAWKRILHYFDTVFDGDTDEEKAKIFFDLVDIDKSGKIDLDELSQSFEALGILIDDRQARIFKDGLPGGSTKEFLALEDFTEVVRIERRLDDQRKREEKQTKTAALMKRVVKLVKEEDIGLGLSLQLNLSDWTFDQIADMCTQRIADRLELDLKLKRGLVFSSVSDVNGKDYHVKRLRSCIQKEAHWFNPSLTSEYKDDLYPGDSEQRSAYSSPEREAKSESRYSFSVPRAHETASPIAFGDSPKAFGDHLGIRF